MRLFIIIVIKFFFREKFPLVSNGNNQNKGHGNQHNHFNLNVQLDL